MAERERWSSTLSFTLAAAGSAVGLGNLWKFPYITWDYGGGGFVLVYLACIAGIGFPLMVSELLIGRAAQRSVVDALERLGGPSWRVGGWLGVATSLVIFSFYAVIAGWSLYSFVKCLAWSWSGYTPDPPEAFGTFMANGPLQVGLGLAFLAITALVVVRGVGRGIDRAAKILMPGLFIILAYMLVTTVQLPGFGPAMRFLFRLDFSQVDQHVVLVALGHAFFTLSVGIGAMVTYGSYLERSDRLLRVSAVVTAIDTLTALAACAVLFPIIFSVPELAEKLDSGEQISSAGMLFVTLPDLFYRYLPGGAIVAPLFFLLVGFAALSSTIPVLELVVSTFMERRDMTRPKATRAASGVIALGVCACALSLGASPTLSGVQAMGKRGVLAIFDHLAANWMLPLGGLVFVVFAGWFLPPETIGEQLGVDAHGRPSLAARTWRVFARFVCPLGIGWILFAVLRGGDFS